MRLPQELIDAIVARVERGIDLLVLHSTSRTVFSSQVLRSLRHVPVHLATDESYRLLSEVLKNHPSALSQIRRIEISLESYTETTPEWHALPAILDACSGINVLRISVGYYREWVRQFPQAHRQALYRCMQLPTLRELHLNSISFDAQAIKELRALTLPPSLRHISVSRLQAASPVRDSRDLAVSFDRLPNRDSALSIASFACDHESIVAGMLLFRARQGRPAQTLRVLALTAELSAANEHSLDDTRPQMLLMANPQLEHLILRTEHWSLPTTVDLSGNKALRTLTIDFPRWRESREAGYVVGVLDSISDAGRRNLERFEFIGAGRAADEPNHGYFWCTIDVALSRLEGLKAVSVRLTPPPREKGMACDEEWEKAQVTAAVESSMRETYGRGILEVTSE